MELVEGVATVEDVDEFVASLASIGTAHDVTVQAFDARAIVDRTHLERAVELADRAVERGENVARDRGVEIMLWAAGRRQIDQALELGIEVGTGPVVVVVAGDARASIHASEQRHDDADDRANTSGERAAASAIRDLLDGEESTLGTYDQARVRDVFGIGDAELAAVDGDLPDLVHERVALLAVER